MCVMFEQIAAQITCRSLDVVKELNTPQGEGGIHATATKKKEMFRRHTLNVMWSSIKVVRLKCLNPLVMHIGWRSNTFYRGERRCVTNEIH